MWEFPASQQLHTFATPAVHLPQSSLQGTVKNLTTTISQIHFAWRVMTSLWRTATADRHGLAVSDAAPCVTSSDVKVPRRAHKQHLSRRVACTVNKLMQIQASPFARKQEQLAAHWGRREGVGGGLTGRSAGSELVLSGSCGVTFHVTLLLTSERATQQQGRSASDWHTDAGHQLPTMQREQGALRQPLVSFFPAVSL